MHKACALSRIAVSILPLSLSLSLSLFTLSPYPVILRLLSPAISTSHGILDERERMPSFLIFIQIERVPRCNVDTRWLMAMEVARLGRWQILVQWMRSSQTIYEVEVQAKISSSRRRNFKLSRLKCPE